MNSNASSCNEVLIQTNSYKIKKSTWFEMKPSNEFEMSTFVVTEAHANDQDSFKRL